MTVPRRFPPPWTAEDDGACFIVRDGNRQSPTSITSIRSQGAAQTANLVTREEAEDLAANIAKLPELLKAPQH